MSRRLLAALALILFSSLALADDLRVVAGNSDVVFDEYSGLPKAWTVCSPDCADPAARRSQVFCPEDGYLRISTPVGPGGAFSATIREEAESVVVLFTASAESYQYRIFKTRPEVELELPPFASMQLATGSSFVPQQLPGFGAIYSRVAPVQVDSDGQQSYDDVTDQASSVATLTNWTGIRNRYWTMLVQPLHANLQASIGMLDSDKPVITVSGGEAGQPARYRIYAGPVAWQSLKSVAPELSEMLFAALWDPLRALCFGMLMLLDLIFSFVGSYGLAIVLLSLSVKILMYPLTKIADSWQEQVNRTHSLLKPDLDEIRRNFRGEEAHERTLDVYKKHQVSPMYTFKSAAGFLLQMPVFIAAFDMLAEKFALNQIAFLWISDLAKPDHIADLPWVLPFFGGWLNLLPFLMSALSITAAMLQREDSLSPALQKQQSIRLYLMSAAFFVLFYTFPAGMVLYWTSSNLFHLLKVEGARVLRR